MAGKSPVLTQGNTSVNWVFETLLLSAAQIEFRFLPNFPSGFLNFLGHQSPIDIVNYRLYFFSIEAN